MNNKMYVVQKAIMLNSGNSIKVGTTIQYTHGNFYMDGGLLPVDYQQDFAMLVDYESKNGWNYLRPENFSNVTNKFYD